MQNKNKNIQNLIRKSKNLKIFFLERERMLQQKYNKSIVSFDNINFFEWDFPYKNRSALPYRTIQVLRKRSGRL